MLQHRLNLGDSLDLTPAAPGVVMIEFDSGAPYGGRCRNVRRRLERLLGSTTATGEPLSDHVRRVSYEISASTFQTNWLLYVVGTRAWPDSYRRRLKLRTPPCLKVHVANEFPRTSITTRLRSRRALFYGPFRSRAVAERFEDEFLDFYGVRRCSERLEPDPGHPGCVYGEMGKCLRPCQAAVSVDAYRSEAGRLLEGLSSSGSSISAELEAARDQASEALEFEEAARRHDQLEKLKATLRLGEDLTRDLDHLHGAVLQRSESEAEILIWLLYSGFFQQPLRFSLEADAAAPRSLDRRLRERIEAVEWKRGSATEREDHLALLRRWQYSSWRKGELVVFDTLDRLPYRRLVNAISRVASARPARRQTSHGPESHQPESRPR